MEDNVITLELTVRKEGGFKGKLVATKDLPLEQIIGMCMMYLHGLIHDLERGGDEYRKFN